MHRTVTSMGARRLRDWLSQPLATAEPIRRRQEAVKMLIENSVGLQSLRAQLAQVRDLERTIGRLSAGTGNARDLIALRLALEQIPELKRVLRDFVAASRAGRERLTSNAELGTRSAASEPSLLTSVATEELQGDAQRQPSLLE